MPRLGSYRDPIANFGRQASAYIMKVIREVPPHQRPATLKIVFDRIEPGLYERVAKKATELERNKGYSPKVALQKAMAISMANGLAKEYVKLGTPAAPMPQGGFLGLGVWGDETKVRGGETTSWAPPAPTSGPMCMLSSGKLIPGMYEAWILDAKTGLPRRPKAGETPNVDVCVRRHEAGECPPKSTRLVKRNFDGTCTSRTTAEIEEWDAKKKAEAEAIRIQVGPFIFPENGGSVREYGEEIPEEWREMLARCLLRVL
jgi:hypothetical protein